MGIAFALETAMKRLTLGILLLTLSCLSAPGLHAETHAVIVSGLGGSPEYTESFTDAAHVFAEALQTLDTDEDRIIKLDESATREDILAAIAQRADAISSGASTTFVLILVGHGNADSSNWRFNVTGPDLTTDDLVAALNEVQSSRQLVVLAASASGAALQTLSQPQRVVVTATKSGGEINAVRFPTYLSDAMKATSADYDRNEILTIGEAFRFAEARTVEYYEQQRLLASEHARLSSDGPADIAIALLGSLRQAQDDPEVAQLLDQRLVLEDEFRELTLRKPDMPLFEYYDDLEVLLIKIARLQRSIDSATGWSESDAES